MNKKIFTILAVSLFAVSCKKNDLPAPPAAAVKFMSLTAASTWNYETVDNILISTSPYIITSTSKDSSINGKTYHVFTNSSGSANEYYNITGSDYYNFRKLPSALGATSVEYIYLKDNAEVGTSWSQSYPVNVSGTSLNATLKNTITAKGTSKTVKGVTYADVIHVTTTVTISFLGIPLPTTALTTDIQSYYAPKVGLIQSTNKINLNYAGVVDNSNQQTNLNTSNIK